MQLPIQNLEGLNNLVSFEDDPEFGSMDKMLILSGLENLTSMKKWRILKVYFLYGLVIAIILLILV